MDIASVLWLVPALPLIGALVNGFRAVEGVQQKKQKKLTNLIALGSTLLSAVVATFYVVIPYIKMGTSEPLEAVYYTWIPAGMGQVAGGFIADFSVQLGFQVDPLSSTMMMVVCWVGFLIHVYATGYMAHETGYTRFFSYFNLFMFMMLLLVLGNNYGVMFVGWEGVGLCSYLLIGFFYDKKFAADAGKKAFIVNRIGDFGFLVGLFLIFNCVRDRRLHEGLRARELRPGAFLRDRDGDLHPAVRRRLRQVGSAPALRLAAGRDGGPHAGLRPHPRGDDGHGGRLHGRPLERPVPPLADRHARRRRRRRRDGALRRDHRHRAERHQEGPRVLDGLPARLHVPRRSASARSPRRSSTS